MKEGGRRCTKWTGTHRNVGVVILSDNVESNTKGLHKTNKLIFNG